MGGPSFRWLGAVIATDGKIGLIVNSTAPTFTDMVINVDTWHDLALTYDGSVGRLYLDEIEIVSKTITINFGNEPMVPRQNFFRWLIDLRFFDRPTLTVASELTSLGQAKALSRQ